MDLDALLQRIGGPNVAIAIAVGVLGIYVLARLFRRPKESPHVQTRHCRRCGWTGQVSKYRPVCPRCGDAFGEG